MEHRCVCCGNMTIDDLVFHDGTTRMGVLGGDAVYCAIGAALWGVPVSLAAVAGPDYPVARLSETLGIDTSAVAHGEQPSLRNWGLYEQDGTRQFIFRSPPGQWAVYSPRPRDIPADVIRGSVFHCAPIPWDMQIDIVKHARESGARFISVDPPYQYLDGMNAQELGRLLQLVDAFLPSRQEARAIFPRLAPEDALQALIEAYPHLAVIVMKLGEEGAIGWDRAAGRKFRLPAFSTQVVDPTGAGDSFCGGFIAGWALSGDPCTAALHGAVSASFVVETAGTLGMGGVSVEDARRRLTELSARAGQETAGAITKNTQHRRNSGGS